jgi:hypothetical protein
MKKINLMLKGVKIAEMKEGEFKASFGSIKFSEVDYSYKTKEMLGLGMATFIELIKKREKEVKREMYIFLLLNPEE